jgi:hypothetical protein
MQPEIAGVSCSPGVLLLPSMTALPHWLSEFSIDIAKVNHKLKLTLSIQERFLIKEGFRFSYTAVSER